jgi:hypothetical protein
MDADHADEDAPPAAAGGPPAPAEDASPAVRPAPDAPRTADGAAAGAPASCEGPRRALKLVVSLRPGGGTGYRALLALGADGCDPVLRAVEVADLQTALNEVPGLAAEAEARWREGPRNPTVRPTAKARPTALTRPSAPPPAPAPRRDAPAESEAPPVRGGQLSFLG